MRIVNAEIAEEITQFLVRVMRDERLPVKAVHNGAHCIVYKDSRISDLTTIWRMGMRINYLESELNRREQCED